MINVLIKVLYLIKRQVLANLIQRFLIINIIYNVIFRYIASCLKWIWVSQDAKAQTCQNFEEE